MLENRSMHTLAWALGGPRKRYKVGERRGEGILMEEWRNGRDGKVK
jgi:hypothetical protein